MAESQCPPLCLTSRCSVNTRLKIEGINVTKTKQSAQGSISCDGGGGAVCTVVSEEVKDEQELGIWVKRFWKGNSRNNGNE